MRRETQIVSDQSRRTQGVRADSAAAGVCYSGPLMDDTPIDVTHARIEPASSAEVATRVLFARMARGDEQALVDFYRTTGARVYAFVSRIVGPTQAEEVTADVYLQIWQQAHRYDAARGDTIQWLYTIARSRALDALRRCDRAECHPQPQDLRPDLYHDGDDPQTLLLALERGQALHTALASLSGEQRRVVELAFFFGFTHSEIARDTGWPLGSVKTLARRALQCLRAALTPPAPVT